MFRMNRKQSQPTGRWDENCEQIFEQRDGRMRLNTRRGEEWRFKRLINRDGKDCCDSNCFNTKLCRSETVKALILLKVWLF